MGTGGNPNLHHPILIPSKLLAHEIDTVDSVWPGKPVLGLYTIRSGSVSAWAQGPGWIETNFEYGIYAHRLIVTSSLASTRTHPRNNMTSHHCDEIPRLPAPRLRFIILAYVRSPPPVGT